MARSYRYTVNRRTILAGGPLCFYCERAPATTADHVIPVKHGGSDELDNLVPACRTCNRAKSATLPWDWKPDAGHHAPTGSW